MDGHQRATAVAEHGLEGCAHARPGGKRQVLFASREHLDAVGVDELGKPVAPGETGILHVRGPHVMVGYWNKPEQTAEMIVEGPLPEALARSLGASTAGSWSDTVRSMPASRSKPLKAMSSPGSASAGRRRM